MIAGSKSPLRVPIMTPSSGVKPIEVSMTFPLRIAAIEAPLPRWQVMMPRAFLYLRAWLATYLWLVPWKPYLRMPCFL